MLSSMRRLDSEHAWIFNWRSCVLTVSFDLYIGEILKQVLHFWPKDNWPMGPTHDRFGPMKRSFSPFSSVLTDRVYAALVACCREKSVGTPVARCPRWLPSDSTGPGCTLQVRLLQSLVNEVKLHFAKNTQSHARKKNGMMEVSRASVHLRGFGATALVECNCTFKST